MIEVDEDLVFKIAQDTLQGNDSGAWTIPSKKLYPHQWLWDSCFTAIGLRHLDPKRAATELRSLLRGQWDNGMIPHMIFSPQKWKIDDSRIWQSHKISGSPTNVRTSGITQPPLMAEATSRVAEMLDGVERKKFLMEMVPAIIRYHQWLYWNRDPKGTGLALLLHPWETGLDNSPSWMSELRKIHTPFWIKVVDLMRVDRLISLFRRDIKTVPSDQRMKTSDLLRLHHAQQDLRRHDYEMQRVFTNTHRHFMVESLSFNSILMRNNEILVDLANQVDIEVPKWLLGRFKKAKESLQQLCNPVTGICYHRNYDEQVIEEVPTISILLPLYSGVITQHQAQQLVNLMTNENIYWLPYPVPSVPKTAEYFDEKRYWQGPTWLNTNWLIVDGLRRYGFQKEADHIVEQSLKLVESSGSKEYFSPISGEGLGADNFSWTAALALDFLKNK